MRGSWKRGTALGAVLLAGLGLASPAPAGAERGATTIAVGGLGRPVDLVVDEWGVPHLYAQDTADLFLAQGFNIARDRLFQVDTWRRRGLGQLSEVLGPAYVEQDRAARLFRYRGDMAAEWASYGPEARLAASRFAEGINAYIDYLGRNPDALPVEFRKLGYRPAKWRPEDVVRIRTHAIGENLSWEVARAKLVCLAGPEGSRVFRGLHPDHTAQVPPGLDPCAIPDDVLKVYNQATAAVSFDRRSGVVSPALSADGTDKAIEDATTGSNSWAIGPGRTATGRPILANDPHRGADALPSGRYLAQLSAPGLNLEGAGEPWNPGIAIGHNGTVAFGLTNLPVDQTDLYVYDLDPADPTRYRYQGGWEMFSTVAEDIPVKGAAATRAQLQFTRHGPVVKVDEAGHKAYAVRTVWTEPGTSPYLASLNYQRSRDYRQFKNATAKWRTPGSNLVFADIHGDIAYVPAGLTPDRTGENYDGLLPVPGDGRYDWNGFHANAELGGVLNPGQGFFASANDYNLPPDQKVIPNYEWQLPYRQQRISEIIAATPMAAVRDSIALQNDEKSLVATNIVPFVATLSSDDPDTRAAIDLLRGYDGVTAAGSAPAALFEQWIMMHLYPGWAHRVLPQAAADAMVRNINPDFSLVIASFADPVRWFGPDGAAVRDDLLRTTLKTAFADVRAQLGPDTATWQWGRMHLQEFVHPLGAPNVGPTPIGGSYHTIHPSFYNPMTHRQVIGATFKMSLDVGGWDNSLAINAPGQSGDERSRHYRDLMPTYTAGRAFPLLYSRSEVEKHADRRIRLVPSR
ncbi:penicillin acylase family protein [Actinokineospora enzanensis]|uniref:penicillin acylase family protein n=1 Tax=Actinokineospora enzanensis TaxID=155975 RepID=UPI0003788EF9|nr:penicillin acylase family protein [Actinokineospora enzanensis]